MCGSGRRQRFSKGTDNRSRAILYLAAGALPCAKQPASTASAGLKRVYSTARWPAYKKVIDPDGVTTEYVRCPDPTSNLVAKIVRNRLA